MKKAAALTLSLAIVSISFAIGNPNLKFSVEEYISTYKEICVDEMHRTGIPASIKMAQGILESRYGNSDLATKANNHFGIKCHKEWNGEEVYHDDDKPDECFRVYASAEQSFKDHSEFLTTRQRYSGLFLIDEGDYKAWAEGLKKAGYATNPKYDQLLIKIIEEHRLFDLDNTSPILALSKEDEVLIKELEEVKGALKPTDNNATDNEPITLTGKKNVSFEEANNPEYIGHIVYFNNVKTYIAHEGDNYRNLAHYFSLDYDKMLAYNEIDKNIELNEGDKVYLASKRNKSVNEVHYVEANQSMAEVAQLHGIQLKWLLKRNKLERGQEPLAGEQLVLKGKRHAPPKLDGNFGTKHKKKFNLKESLTFNKTNDIREENTDSLKKKQLSTNADLVPKVPEKKKVKSKTASQAKKAMESAPKPTAKAASAPIYLNEATTGKKETPQTKEPKQEQKAPATVIDEELLFQPKTPQPVNKLEEKTGNEFYAPANAVNVAPVVKEVREEVKVVETPSVSPIVVEEAKPALPIVEETKAPPTTTAPKVELAPATTQTYTVKPKDTLYSLSRRFGVTVDALKSRNGLLDNGIKIGQVLLIP